MALDWRCLEAVDYSEFDKCLSFSEIAFGILHTSVLSWRAPPLVLGEADKKTVHSALMDGMSPSMCRFGALALACQKIYKSENTASLLPFQRHCMFSEVFTDVLYFSAWLREMQECCAKRQVSISFIGGANSFIARI